MKQLKKKRIGLYARVSTEMQTDGYSIQGQLNQLTEYCQFQGYEVVNEYTDRGISGKTMQRPELQRMLKDANEGKLDCIMVYKTNRLARNTSDLLNIVEELYKINVEFFSLTEKIEIASSTGKLMLQILASFAEFERNTIVENVYNGQRQRAIEGYYQGNLPLGYDKVPDSKKELMINQHEANIVKYIFDSYAKGHGYRKIANALNHKGYVTKKGKPFSISSITYIISNPFYIGKIQFAKYRHWSDKRRKGLNEEPIIADGKHAPIIDRNLWDKVQFKRQESRKKPQVHGKGTNLLTGIVKCPKCGAAMAASNTITKTIEDSPDLDSVLKPTILSYQDELNQINNQIYQLEQDKQAEAPHYDADMIANVLQAIFKDIDKLEKSQLKSLYLTIIDRIDIRKDEHHKKQFYVTLKLNNDIIKQLFNNHPLDEVLPSTSSLFLPQTLYITIE